MAVGRRPRLQGWGEGKTGGVGGSGGAGVGRYRPGRTFPSPPPTRPPPNQRGKPHHAGRPLHGCQALFRSRIPMVTGGLLGARHFFGCRCQALFRRDGVESPTGWHAESRGGRQAGSARGVSVSPPSWNERRHLVRFGCGGSWAGTLGSAQSRARGGVRARWGALHTEWRLPLPESVHRRHGPRPGAPTPGPSKPPHHSIHHRLRGTAATYPTARRPRAHRPRAEAPPRGEA
jgi:hypothetical protein